ncbi:hypothetical protein LHA31_07690 [Carnobacterium viridans]|uniref:Uncharacterized protein n=1 Tax=Carnobacterium viridans TaxID=174587 RepID=A0A1H0ZSJ2_9LACT|nr:hypothetical protein [Carnobacterium viridans]UDE94490.1 hypothetical protein LHA31_07690 [Carnobacterium viridans]SDQ30329.1 hypothetical protein SAMN04487752_1690 [Carnobacterium viridans]
MGDIIMKKLTKRSCYQVVSIIIFCGAILAVLNTELIFGYVLIILGYYLLRKSELED